MALQYLLAPTFQFINTAGKPLSGGAYMEVYVHGTRTKYFCASDFDGTLHPFRIPLDSLGSNIVLASDTGSYDIYAYNRYGTLTMSRYNVKPGGGGGSGGDSYTAGDGISISNQDVISVKTDGSTIHTNSSGALEVLGGDSYTAGDGIDITNSNISVKYDKGLEITSDNKLRLKVGEGLTFDDNSRIISSIGNGIYLTADGKLTTKEPEDNFIDITNEWEFDNGFRLQYRGVTPGEGNDMRILYSPVSDTVKFISACRINSTSPISGNAWYVMMRYKGDRFYTTNNTTNPEYYPKISTSETIGGVYTVIGTDSGGATSNAFLKFSYIGTANNTESETGLAIQNFINPYNSQIYGTLLSGLRLSVTKKI